MKVIIFFLCAFMLSVSAYSQESVEVVKKKKVHGTFYLTWGYHRDNYSKSNIHFKDSKTGDYDFTLYKAKASDRLDIYDNFLGGEALTIPQYVFYGGYFFGNKGDWGIELGWDHLKYIVDNNQVLHLKGTINGQYYDQDTLINPAFIQYEHTNGNNYLMANVLKRYTFFKSPRANHKLSAIVKVGAGILVPKTYSVVMGKTNDGPFRPSGIVVGTALALRYDLLKYFFIEHSIKGAVVDYTAVKLYGEGRAKQQFLSLQYIFSFGLNIPMSKN